MPSSFQPAWALMAARHGALSVDHLEHLDDDGIAAMAASGTVAALLPGAFYFTREENCRRSRACGRAGADRDCHHCNPGTSPLTSAADDEHGSDAVPPDGGMSRRGDAPCRAGIGRNDIGALVPGKWADLAIWDVTRPPNLSIASEGGLHARHWRGR
jgi:imidazolonepropionase